MGVPADCLRRLGHASAQDRFAAFLGDGLTAAGDFRAGLFAAAVFFGDFADFLAATFFAGVATDDFLAGCFAANLRAGAFVAARADFTTAADFVGD